MGKFLGGHVPPVPLWFRCLCLHKDLCRKEIKVDESNLFQASIALAFLLCKKGCKHVWIVFKKQWDYRQ